MAALGPLVGLGPTMSSGGPAPDTGAGTGFDGLVAIGEAVDLPDSKVFTPNATYNSAVVDEIAMTEEATGPDGTPLVSDMVSSPLPCAVLVFETVTPAQPATDATIAADDGMVPAVPKAAWTTVLAVDGIEDAPELHFPSGSSDPLIESSAVLPLAVSGPAMGPSQDTTPIGGNPTGRTAGVSVGAPVEGPLARTVDAAPADVGVSTQQTDGSDSVPLSPTARTQDTGMEKAPSANTEPGVAAENPAVIRKLARSSRLTIDRATPPSDVAMADTATGDTGTAQSVGAGQLAPDARYGADAHADLHAEQPDAGPGGPDADAGVVGADAGMETGAAMPRSTDRPTLTAQSFEALLSKVPEAPTPRSSLVQAAVERLAPLPATPGETVLRLNPHGLGVIEVVIQEGRNGALDVALRVQNPLVLDAMRQEREAVAVVFSAPQGGAEGSLTMDLMQSGTRQGGAGADTGGQPQKARQLALDIAADETPDATVRQLVSADSINIVT